MALPTNRTTSTSIADHVADHNVLHEQHNDLEGHAEATTDVHGIADTSQLATNADVAAAVAGLVDSAPATLDTLNELAAALGDDESFATTVTTALAGKAATGHDHDVDYEAAGAVATHAADTTDVHGIADTSALALTSHTHSGTYVPVPAEAPTPGQILSATDDDPLTTDWIDAPSGGAGVPIGRAKRSDGTIYYTVPGVFNLFFGTRQISSHRLYYMPFHLTTEITIDQLALAVISAGAASTAARLGIYNADTDWQPTTLVLDAGAVAVDSLGVKTISVSQALPAGRYLFALNSNGSPTLRLLQGSPLGAPIGTGLNAYVALMYKFASYAAFGSPGLAWDGSSELSNPTEYFIFCRVSTP